MDKKQAGQEILRRLNLYFKRFSIDSPYNSILTIKKYKVGLIPKQELIKMITVDADGNLLSEPENYQEYLFDGGKAFEFDSSIARWKNKCKQYQKALNQATEIVNCYEDKQED